MKYKVVPGPMSISVEQGKSDTAFSSFQSIINSNSVDGWRYHSMENITVSEKQGCGSAPVNTVYYMLIFEHDD